ncbi:hypothetical protein [Mesorhizobium sp. M1295]|uniref:hypothetical protein n=1 Tax=Mesorhizobium sp. M1295 TaxID=2957076 RepID=UPI0033350BB4
MTDLPKLINSKHDVSDRVAMLVLDRDDVRNGPDRRIVRTVDWINGDAAVWYWY